MGIQSNAVRRGKPHWSAGAFCASLCLLSIAVLAVLTATSVPSHALVGISGTLCNFDVFNDTSTNAYGAELELEGCHANEVTKTYPSHFDQMTMTEYSSGSVYGTRITFTGYNFLPIGYIEPTVGQTTNGHYAVNLPGCEHFGFSVSVQPTATRYFWLDGQNQRIGTVPMSVPTPSFTYVPPANPGGQAVVKAVVKVPEPEQPEPQLPDSIWMKVYVTELEREVDLLELISGPPDQVIVPQDQAEIETEWELLEGGVNSEADAPVSEKGVSIIKRYEFFKYTGAYDPEDHSPLSGWNGIGDPPANELGDFIAANMVAVNLVPEPSTVLVLSSWIGMSGLVLRRRGRGAS